MAIESRTQDYKSHKHNRTVYVDLNPKTKIGSDLIGQYHEQTKNHCMDIGRIGSHDDHGRYKIDYYTIKELVVIPKLIIRVTERAISRAGKDIYQLRTYMSKFGQLNFLLLVDRDKAELILVENVHISNLNHTEEYETTLWVLKYYNQKPIPLAEIFYKFGIRANPDDYGKSWKEDKVEINNILASKAKADMTIKLANTVASSINQKALVASLNYLNKEGEYGKKITSAYSKKVASKKEINSLAASPKLENTLNHILLKTLEEKTDKKDLKDTSNLRVYKKVLDIQLSTPNAISSYVEQNNTKQNFKGFLLNVYQDDNKKEDKSLTKIKEEHVQFEKIIEYKFSDKPKREKIEINEENLDKHKTKNFVLPKEFKDFDNNLVDVDTNLNRFEKEESKQQKRERLKKQKEKQKLQKNEKSQKAKKQKGLRRVNALCDIDNEFEKSKAVIGLTPDLDKNNKKKASKKLKELFETKEKKKQQKSEKVKDIVDKKQKSREDILKKLEKKVKNQTAKKQAKLEKREKSKEKKLKKVQEKIEKKQLKKEKQSLIKEYLSNKKEKDKKKKKVNTALMEKSKSSKKEKKSSQIMDRPVLKPKEEKVDQSSNLQEEKNIKSKPNQHVASQVEKQKLEQNTDRQVVKPVKSNEETKKQILDNIASKLQAEKENVAKQNSSLKQENTLGGQTTKQSSAHHQHFDISTNTTRKHKERTMDM